MKKIKVGQIGIGHNHGNGKMEAVRKFSELFECVGYAESDEKWIKERGQFECYRDLPRMSVEEVLEKSDAVLVECDVWNLTQTAAMCVAAGKHVHVDKPASGSFSEFEGLVASARAQNLTLQLGYMYRYNHAINRCMEMIRAGELGEIYQIDAEMSTYHSHAYREWLKRFKGGSMYIFGSHLIDLVVVILGEPNKVTSFIKQTDFEGVHCDDNGFAVLEYDRAIAKITTLSVEVNGWGMRRFAVMGSRGTVEIKPMELDVQMTKSTLDIVKNHYRNCFEKIEVEDISKTGRYDLMMKDFYASIVGEKPNPFSYERELLTQKILCQLVGEN